MNTAGKARTLIITGLAFLALACASNGTSPSPTDQAAPTVEQAVPLTQVPAPTAAPAATIAPAPTATPVPTPIPARVTALASELMADAQVAEEFQSVDKLSCYLRAVAEGAVNIQE